MKYCIFISLQFYVSPKLSLVALSIVPPIAVTAIIYGRYVRNITRRVQDALADSTQVIFLLIASNLWYLIKTEFWWHCIKTKSNKVPHSIPLQSQNILIFHVLNQRSNTKDKCCVVYIFRTKSVIWQLLVSIFFLYCVGSWRTPGKPEDCQGIWKRRQRKGAVQQKNFWCSPSFIQRIACIWSILRICKLP